MGQYTVCVCVFLSVCAFLYLTSMSVYVCLSALERLQPINQSATRGSSFSRLARISLLNSNLSVKYSLTGHLAVTDLISDGFYDAGKVCVCMCTIEMDVKQRPLKGM